MKRLFPVFLAIALCGGLVLYFSRNPQPNPAPPSQIADSEATADPKAGTSAKTVSKIAIPPDIAFTETAPEPSKPPIRVEFVFSEDDDAESPGEHTHIIQEWKGRFTPSIQDLAAGMMDLTTPQLLNIRLPSGVELDIEITKNKQYGPTRGVFSGRVLGSEFSEAIFSYVNQAVSGSVTMPQSGETLAVKNAGEGFQYLAQVDASKLGECGVCAESRETGEL